jgi:lipoprotein NlpD
MSKFNLLFLCLLVAGCATRNTPAPVDNVTKIPNYLLPNGSINSSAFLAKPDDNAPAPSAAANNTPTTTTMSTLSDNNSVNTINVPPTPANTDKTSNRTVHANLDATSGWIMPTNGKTSGYDYTIKGMDIYGTAGQPIYAANNGKVVYSGNGLKGYGNLIIIKHDDQYLTAYAKNKVNLVKEGDTIERGQKIAQMGSDNNGKGILHFELRQDGKPIDPFSVITAN